MRYFSFSVNMGYDVLKLAANLLCVFLLSGCVSAAIDQNTGKYEGVFYEPASKEEIRDAIGKEPIESYVYSRSNKVAANYNIGEFHSYDVYAIRGKIHKPGAGNRQAAESAATLGLSEIIYIPVTLVELAIEPFKKRTLVVFYDKTDTYIAHQLFDADGNRESIAE